MQILTTRHIKENARSQVQCAREKGRLQYPTKCERCGKEPKEKLHAHHTDYFDALWVEFLCRSCNFKARNPMKWNEIWDRLGFDSETDWQFDDNEGLQRYSHQLAVDGTIRGRTKLFA